MSHRGSGAAPRARSLCTLCGAALIALAPLATARADEARAQQELEQAEQALVNLDYDAANKQIARVLQTHGLTREQLVRAYRVKALTDAVLDKENAAREAFQQLLTIDPAYQGDPNLGPKVQAPFMEARGYMRAQPVQPGVEVSVVLRPSEPGTIRATTRDPTHVARRAVTGWRWGGEGAFQTAPLAVAQGASAQVPPPPVGTTRLDYYVQVLDANDDVVFESGNPAVPKSATVALAPSSGEGATGSSADPQHHSIFASPVFWAIAGVVVVGAAAGTYLAARSTTTTTTVAGTPTGATLSPTFQCGAAKCN